MLKEMIYTGIGGALILKERVETELKELEEKGKLKREDASGFMEKLQQRAEDEEATFKADLKAMIKEVIDELGIATKEDLRKLAEDFK